MSLWNRQKRPERVPTDTVVPVGFFDDTIIFRTFTVYAMFVYDEVLDAVKLHDAMTRLISRPGWNKAGARLRKAASGSGYEHHIPAVFTADRPAVNFTCADHTDTPMQDHPVAGKLPRAPKDGVPAIVADPDDFKSLVYGEGVPIYAADYLYADRPQLGLRVVSFRDATVVTLHWLHLSFDSMGISEILKGWQLILEDREAEIPAPLPADADPLGDFGLHPREPHLLEKVHLKIGGVLGWVARNAWGLLVSQKECRMLCIPGPFWKKLRADAIADLKQQGLPANEQFLSEGDVLLAWFTRLAVAHYDKKTAALPVNIQQAVEIRSKLPDRFPEGRPYLGNAMVFMVGLLPVRQVLNRPVSFLAHVIRKSLVAQTTPDQCEAYGALVRQDPANKAPPFFGQTGMHLLMYTNWCKAKLYETDLGAAIVSNNNKAGGAGGKEKVLKPRYIQTIQGPYDFADGIFVVGKDADENYWISSYRIKGLWGLMEKVIADEWANYV